MERTTEQGVLQASSGGTEVEDATFIRAAQAEPEAFGLIYQRYVDRVYAYMRTRLASEQDAADLTQQVFIRAFQGLPKYRSGRAPFAAWLFRIAANAATDEFRRKRAPALALQFLPESLSPATASAIEPEESGRLELLREQLADLPGRQRELLALRFAAGLTAREIGALTGKSEAAVQKQLSRTLSTLKEHYRAQHLLP